MATRQELEAALDALLDHPLGLRHFRLMRNREDKVYEAYVFGLCLRAVRELNSIPTLRGISGRPDPFIFRGAPGQIHSRSRNYGFASFSLNGFEFELHVGVEYKGTSGMIHEVDVSLMRSEDAEKCRREPGDPRSSSLIGCWECKFYSGILDKALGRAFVGLVDDMSQNVRLSGLCSNATHAELREYMQPQRRPFPHLELSPNNRSQEDIFVNLVKAELKKMTAS